MIYHLFFYVPESHLDTVKTALFNAGAGQIGHYDCCAWQTLGTGQFRPQTGSQPFTGQANQLSQEAEYKVELVCATDHVQAVITALLDHHPYETPAYGLIPLQDINEFK